MDPEGREGSEQLIKLLLSLADVAAQFVILFSLARSLMYPFGYASSSAAVRLSCDLTDVDTGLTPRPTVGKGFENDPRGCQYVLRMGTLSSELEFDNGCANLGRRCCEMLVARRRI
jgi:hypothetical protein